MTAVLDPSKPFSAELHVIRRLNSSLHRGGGGDGLDPGRAGSPRLHPLAGHAMLAPLRDDVPLLDPCCGQLSAGAEVDLGVTGRQKFIDFRHVASALWVPPGFRERPQTVPIHSGIRPDLSKDKAWNSRRIPDAALKAGLNGSSDPVKIQLHSLKTSTQAATHDSEQITSGNQINQLYSRRVLRVFNGQNSTFVRRSYEEVSWDAKLPRRLQPPGTTLEKTADPVSERPSSRRYNGRPQLWQVSHGEQTMTSAAKAGAELFSSLQLTAAKGLYPIPQLIKRVHRAIKESRSSAVGHAAPLSRMLTTVKPCNPFLRPELPASRRDVRQSR
uniref:Uncharacterized protein n=1 Tax=Stegastes partitus TaxID=144197 RepID=A0A3B4Z245_9TELE